MFEIRHHFMAGRWAGSVSARLSSWVPSKLISGHVVGGCPAGTARPGGPVASSQSPALGPSPGAGYVCLRVHCSTFFSAVPLSTCVVMVARRFWVKNVGEVWSQLVVDAQYWSHGTSGQFGQFAFCPMSQGFPGRQRSAEPNVTCIGG